MKSSKSELKKVLTYPEGPLTKPFRQAYKTPPNGLKRYLEDYRFPDDYSPEEWIDETKKNYSEILLALKAHLRIRSEPPSLHFYAELGYALMVRHVPAFLKEEPGAPKKAIDDSVSVFDAFLDKKSALEKKRGHVVKNSEVYLEMSKLPRFQKRDGTSSPGAVKKLVERAIRDIWGQDGKSGTISNPARDKKR